MTLCILAFLCPAGTDSLENIIQNPGDTVPSALIAFFDKRTLELNHWLKFSAGKDTLMPKMRLMPSGSYGDHKVRYGGATVTQIDVNIGVESSRLHCLEIENHFMGFTRLDNSIIVVRSHF